MLRSDSIICFSINEWSDVPRNQVHLMRAARRRGYRILYVETIGLRQPELSTRDAGKILKRLRRAIHSLRQVEPDYWLLSPLAIPVHGIAVVDRVNRTLLWLQVRLAMRRLKMNAPIIWSYLPQVARYARFFSSGPSLYFRCDEYSEYRGVNRERLARMEEEAVAGTDLSVASSARYLTGVLRPARQVLFLPNAVDAAHFGRPPEANPFLGEKRPVILTIGTLEHWLDVSLLEAVARAQPQWSFVLAGPLRTDIAALTALPNVAYLGVVPYERLPDYVAGCDIGLVPFHVERFIAGATPGKVYQYLAAGVPVVATPFVDDPALAKHIYVAATPDEIVAAVQKALSEDGEVRRRERRDAVIGESWDVRFATVEEALLAS